jgi:hypothetical protein
MKAIDINTLIVELQEARVNGFSKVLFDGTIMLSDNTIIVSTEKQM